MVEVYGWRDYRGVQHGVDSFRFNESGTLRSNDWRRFVPGGSADAAISGQQLELRTTVADPAKTRILVYAADNLGDRDPADGSVIPSRPSVVVGQQTVAPDIVVGPSVAFLRLTLNSLGGVPYLSALNVSRSGSSADSVGLSLYRDDGSGALDAADKFLSNASMVGTAASLPMNELVTAPEVLWVEVRWANLTPRSTFGLSVTGINSNGTVSFRPSETGLVYLGAAPVNLRVDGAFGDWRGRPYGQDALGDVTNRTGAPSTMPTSTSSRLPSTWGRTSRATSAWMGASSEGRTYRRRAHGRIRSRSTPTSTPSRTPWKTSSGRTSRGTSTTTTSRTTARAATSTETGSSTTRPVRTAG